MFESPVQFGFFAFFGRTKTQPVATGLLQDHATLTPSGYTHRTVSIYYTCLCSFTTLFTTHCIVHLSKKEIDVIMLYLHHHDDDRGYL